MIAQRKHNGQDAKMHGSPRHVTEIKIFGERNTGTNALKALIERNSSTRVCPSVAKEIDPNFERKTRLLKRIPKPYRARLTESYIDRLFSRMGPRMAWKHSATNFSEIASFDGCPVVLMTRHPESWLLGLHRHPYHALHPVARDLATFLRTNWILTRRDNLADLAMLPADVWNAKARSHLSFAEELSKRNMAFRIVKFEDFVVDQKATFHNLEDLLSDPVDDPSLVQRSTKEADKSYEYYRDYYGKQKWIDEIAEGAREAMTLSIDWGVARDFGYA